MPSSGYLSPFSGAQVDSAVSIALNLGSGTVVSSGGSVIITADSGAYVNGDKIATEEYVDSAVSGATISGALMSDTEIVTTVGDYTISYTSSGGLVISGTAIDALFSSGTITVGASSYDEEAGVDHHMSLIMTSDGAVISGNGSITASVVEGDDDQARITITSGGVNINTSDPTNDIGVSVVPGMVGISGNYAGDSRVAVNVNGRPIATQLVSYVDSTTTYVSQSFAGGTSYIFTQPLAHFEITEINSETTEARVQFSLASDFSPGSNFVTPDFGGFCPIDFTPEVSTNYLMSIVGGNIVIAPYQDKSV